MLTKMRVLLLVTGVAVIAVLSVTVARMHEGGPATAWDWPPYLKPVEPDYILGSLAQDFVLDVLSTGTDVLSTGASIRLADLHGKVVVLNFWNTTCAPCIEEQPDLNATADAYGHNGVRFFGIVTGDNKTSIARFENQYGRIKYPTLDDGAGQVSSLYRRRGVPLTVVIDAKGVVVWWRPGTVDQQTLSSVINAALAGRRPKAETSAKYPDQVRH